MARIYHLAELADWQSALTTGTYTRSTRGADLKSTGFVHTAFPQQVPTVRNKFYGDLSEPLMLLEVDPERLTSSLVVEVGEPATGEEFPHVYGPLNVDAVVGTRQLDPPHTVEVAFDSETEVSRPRDVAWARLTDWASMPQWMPGLTAMRADGPAAEGTVLTEEGSGGVRQWVITCVWPESVLTLTCDAEGSRLNRSFVLSDTVGGGTVVRLVVDSHSSDLRTPALGTDGEQQLAALAELLEH